MEGAQQVIQEGARHWDVLLYLVWPVAVGSYMFTWKIFQSLKEDIAKATSIALAIRDNDLHEISNRLASLETGQAVNTSRLERLEEDR